MFRKKQLLASVVRSTDRDREKKREKRYVTKIPLLFAVSDFSPFLLPACTASMTIPRKRNAEGSCRARGAKTSMSKLSDRQFLTSYRIVHPQKTRETLELNRFFPPSITLPPPLPTLHLRLSVSNEAQRNSYLKQKERHLCLLYLYLFLVIVIGYS